MVAARTGVLAVKGHLYDEGRGAALCETFTSIRGAVIIHDGLNYTEDEIRVLGEIIGGILVIDPTVS